MYQNSHSILVEITLYIMIAFTALVLWMSVYTCLKNFKQRNYMCCITFISSILLGMFLYQFSIFGIYYNGLNCFNKKKYEKAIKRYELAATLSINDNLKSFLYGEIGTAYLLLPKRGFDVISAYNTAYIYSKSYKLKTNNETWPRMVNLIFLNKKKNDIASKWPLIAAKAYTFENHFKEAKRIYFTAKENPIWLGIIITSVLENNYKNALKYADTLVLKTNDYTAYAQRANIHKALGDVRLANIDLQQAELLCKQNKISNCTSTINNLANNFTYNAYQNYFEQRKRMGFE